VKEKGEEERTVEKNNIIFFLPFFFFCGRMRVENHTSLRKV
jgi:hypothetical protein